MILLVFGYSVIAQIGVVLGCNQWSADEGEANRKLIALKIYICNAMIGLKT